MVAGFFFLRIKSFHLKILTRCEFQTSKFGNVQIKNCCSSLLAIIITVNTEVFDYFTLKLWRCSTYIWPKLSSGPENLSRHLQDPQNLRSQKFYTILVICLWKLNKILDANLTYGNYLGELRVSFEIGTCASLWFASQIVGF